MERKPSTHTEQAEKKDVLKLPDIEKMPEDTYEQAKRKWQAMNDYVMEQGKNLPMIHNEIEGSGPDPIENAAEISGDAQEQDYVTDHIVHARAEMVRLNDKAALLKEKAA